jgi:hypothetical protein
MTHDTGRWSGGLTDWVDANGDTAYISIAFTWRLADAYARAVWHKQAGLKVRIGGPGVFTLKEHRRFFEGVAEVGGDYPDAIGFHNPQATMASRGCPVGCSFCIVPKMEGRTFTLLPDFPVRPVLCDNNLSALPADYQRHIIGRYKASGVPLLDANSGFEPRTFDEDVFLRWCEINRGPWRFAYDDKLEELDVERVMRMLRAFGVGARRMQVYVLIGNEPKAACMERIEQVIAWGGEPYVQPYMKLTAPEYRPHVRFDWTERELLTVKRWINGRYWKYAGLAQYRASIRHERPRLEDHPGLPFETQNDVVA